MKLRKLFKRIKACREDGPSPFRIKWNIKFQTDDTDYIFSFLPTIIWMPGIYRYPGTCVIDITWLNLHLTIGTWVYKDRGN